jgi:predicted ATP-dependent serine protease
MALASAFSTTIRGRDPELAAVGEQLARVRSGSGSVLLIEGAAGMGKSRLIAEGVRMAERLSLPAGIGAAEQVRHITEIAEAMLNESTPDPMRRAQP